MVFKFRVARFAVSLVVGLGLLPGVSHADMPVSYRDGGRTLFSVDVPDFWQVRSGGPRRLTAPGETQERAVSRVIGMHPVTEPRVWVGFVSPYGVSDFPAARQYLTDIGPFLVKDAKVETRKPTRVGGYRAQKFAGTGRRDGRSVGFTALIVELPGPRMAVSVVVIEAGADPAILDDVNRIFASFRAR